MPKSRGDYRPLVEKDNLPKLISAIVGSIILIVFLVLGWNIGKPKTITQTFERKPTFEKEEREGGKKDGKIILRAVTENSTRRPEGGHENPRICDEFLVLHFRSQTATEDLAKKLQKVNGVERAEPVGPYRIIVERPCYERHESLWTWNEVWGNIRPIILPYLPQKQGSNPPTPRASSAGRLFL